MHDTDFLNTKKMKKKQIKIKINKQHYLNLLINNYPNLKSGRKNYEEQYKRVLKNLLLTKIYSSEKINQNIFSNKSFFYTKDSYFYLCIEKNKKFYE